MFVLAVRSTRGSLPGTRHHSHGVSPGRLRNLLRCRSSSGAPMRLVAGGQRLAPLLGSPELVLSSYRLQEASLIALLACASSAPAGLPRAALCHWSAVHPSFGLTWVVFASGSLPRELPMSPARRVSFPRLARFPSSAVSAFGQRFAPHSGSPELFCQRITSWRFP